MTQKKLWPTVIIVIGLAWTGCSIVTALVTELGKFQILSLMVGVVLFTIGMLGTKHYEEKNGGDEGDETRNTSEVRE